MPPLETMDLHQKAMLWEAAGVDEYGEITVSDREEISCRLVKGISQSVDALGNPIVYTATLVTDREIEMDSIVWEGSEEELPETVGTAGDLELYQVKAYREARDIKGRNTRRTLLLQRFRGSLPEIV